MNLLNVRLSGISFWHLCMDLSIMRLPSINSAEPPPRCPRRAVIVLELILALPVLIIVLLAVVQFGVLFTNLQHLALASRVGAEKASEQPGLSIVNNDPVPTDVLDAISQQLGGVGISSCRVILIHNVGTPALTTAELISGACNCDAPAPPSPSPGGNFVQVTVITDLAELMPNCLATFGFDISGQFAQQTTIFRHEL